MKKISLFVLVLSLFVACKNDPAASSATTDNAGTSATAAPMSAEKIAEGKAKATAHFKEMNDLITEIDAMPADFRNKPEIQAIRSELGDISGKAEMVMRAIDPNAAGTATGGRGGTTFVPDKGSATTAGTAAGRTDAPSTAPSDATTAMKPNVEDAIASMNSYGEIIAAAHARFNELTGK